MFYKIVNLQWIFTVKFHVKLHEIAQASFQRNSITSRINQIISHIRILLLVLSPHPKQVNIFSCGKVWLRTDPWSRIQSNHGVRTLYLRGWVCVYFRYNLVWWFKSLCKHMLPIYRRFVRVKILHKIFHEIFRFKKTPIFNTGKCLLSGQKFAWLSEGVQSAIGNLLFLFKALLPKGMWKPKQFYKPFRKKVFLEYFPSLCTTIAFTLVCKGIDCLEAETPWSEIQSLWF